MEAATCTRLRGGTPYKMSVFTGTVLRTKRLLNLSEPQKPP